MFLARGLLVSLAFFAVVYCSLSALVALSWSAAERLRKPFGQQSAGLLFGLRIFSFAVSGVITICFAFPSFWLMERSAFDEEAGTFVLAACALTIVGAGVFRVLRDQSRTMRALRGWSLGASGADSVTTKPALGAANGAPALILVGIRRPRVLVSDAAANALSEGELQVAVRHELGHRRSWDNLKKVLISATPFPWMKGLQPAGSARSGGGADQTFPSKESVAGTGAGQRADVRVIIGCGARAAPAAVARRSSPPSHLAVDPCCSPQHDRRDCKPLWCYAGADASLD